MKLRFYGIPYKIQASNALHLHQAVCLNSHEECSSFQETAQTSDLRRLSLFVYTNEQPDLGAWIMLKRAVWIFLIIFLNFPIPSPHLLQLLWRMLQLCFTAKPQKYFADYGILLVFPSGTLYTMLCVYLACWMASTHSSHSLSSSVRSSRGFCPSWPNTIRK